jgi:hypothetical protein
MAQLPCHAFGMVAANIVRNPHSRCNSMSAAGSTLESVHAQGHFLLAILLGPVADDMNVMFL